MNIRYPIYEGVYRILTSMWLMAFLPAWKKKNNMTLLLFFEVKAVIEEHYERRIEFYRYVNPPLSREAERELGEWKGKVREIMRMC